MEQTKDPVRRLREILDSKNYIFRDKSCLEYLVVPPKIIGRYREIKIVFRAIYPKNGYLVPFVHVHGSSGTGKSTIVKYLCKEMQDVISFSFVNLRMSKSNFECANLILKKLDSKPVKHYEGISTALDLIEKQIYKILQKGKRKNFILILDEFDQIFVDKRVSPSDFVFKLLELVANLRNKGFSLCIVGISNTPISNYQLDQRVKSRMEGNEIFFRPYQKNELMIILKERAEKAFVDGAINDDVLEKCAELSGDDNGDCRKALQLLKIAGELAEMDKDDIRKLTIKKVDAASRKLEKDNLEHVLYTATLHQKILLLALSKCVYTTDEEEHSTTKIYDEYRNLTHICDAPNILKIRQISNLLALLENTGIITSQKNSKGTYGLKRSYHLNIPCDIVGNLTFPHIWHHIKSEQKKFERFVQEINERQQKYQKILKSASCN